MLPDMRGVFLRGVDGGRGQDPDTGSRSASFSGGNAADAVGSYQADMFASHSHYFQWGNGYIAGASPNYEVPIVNQGFNTRIERFWRKYHAENSRNRPVNTGESAL
jgi:hypothetical protein